jgi:hypothetical protein
MKNLYLFLLVLVALTSCTSDSKSTVAQPNTNKILMLKVDYTTNTFEGGKEFEFDVTTPTFTTNIEYVQPSDIGNIKVFYTELNTLLFEGSIHWAGTGQINYPTDFLPASSFQYATIENFYQEPVFTTIFDANTYPQNIPTPPYNYSPIWVKLQALLKVRAYRDSNPNATAKIFLYQPGVAIGDPATYKWIIIFKN